MKVLTLSLSILLLSLLTSCSGSKEVTAFTKANFTSYNPNLGFFNLKGFEICSIFKLNKNKLHYLGQFNHGQYGYYHSEKSNTTLALNDNLLVTFSSTFDAELTEKYKLMAKNVAASKIEIKLNSYNYKHLKNTQEDFMKSQWYKNYMEVGDTFAVCNSTAFGNKISYKINNKITTDIEVKVPKILDIDTKIAYDFSALIDWVASDKNGHNPSIFFDVIFFEKIKDGLKKVHPEKLKLIIQ